MLGRPSGGARGPYRRVLPKMFAALRKVAGMPDYQAYVEHLRCTHPERAVPTQREFYDEYVRCRYGDGPTRCC